MLVGVCCNTLCLSTVHAMALTLRYSSTQPRIFTLLSCRKKSVQLMLVVGLHKRCFQYAPNPPQVCPREEQCSTLKNRACRTKTPDEIQRFRTKSVSPMERKMHSQHQLETPQVTAVKSQQSWKSRSYSHTASRKSRKSRKSPNKGMTTVYAFKSQTPTTTSHQTAQQLQARPFTQTIDGLAQRL